MDDMMVLDMRLTPAFPWLAPDKQQPSVLRCRSCSIEGHPGGRVGQGLCLTLQIMQSATWKLYIKPPTGEGRLALSVAWSSIISVLQAEQPVSDLGLGT
jgi:hypothetical protein